MREGLTRGLQGLAVSADRQALLGFHPATPGAWREEAATATEGDGRSGRRQAARPVPGRYGVLLSLLIATYLASAFTRSHWIGAAQLAVFVATGFLALRSSGLPLRRARLLGLVGLAVSVAAFALTVARPNDEAVAAASIWTGLLLLATVVVIVRRILAFDTITIQSIFAAVSAYLMIGLMFAAFYAADYQLHSHVFFADNRPGNSQTFQYFSFTTLTTLGYGDFTAEDPGGRAVAVLEALTGQIFLATLVARLVAGFRRPSGQEENREREQG
jgi:voltage-gated potassium channel Kch